MLTADLMARPRGSILDPELFLRPIPAPATLLLRRPPAPTSSRDPLKSELLYVIVCQTVTVRLCHLAVAGWLLSGVELAPDSVLSRWLSLLPPGAPPPSPPPSFS